jgi:hypothetical protein
MLMWFAVADAGHLCPMAKSEGTTDPQGIRGCAPGAITELVGSRTVRSCAEGSGPVMLSTGDRVTYRLLPEMASSKATVLSVDGDIVSLSIEEDAPQDIPVGRDIALVSDGAAMDFFAEVTARDGDVLRVKQKWTGRRSFFRVDDVLPLASRKVTDPQEPRRSHVFPWYSADAPDIEAPGAAVDAQLWKMFVEINRKLGMLLDSLVADNGQMKKYDRKAVNISASGIRFTVHEQHEAGEVVELKMMLPVSPPLGVIAYGQVARAEKLVSGGYGVALHFIDLDDETQETIIQYVLKRQRETMRNRQPRAANE